MPFYFPPLIILLAYLTIMFIIVNLKKDMSIGNFTWGGIVMILALYSFFMNPYLPRHILATALTIIWGVRLAAYAYLRYRPGADPRFVTWHQHGGRWAFIQRAGWIYFLNGSMGIIMSLPIVAINMSIMPDLNWLDGFATVLWLIGFYFETVADYQLYIFRKNPANQGQVLSTGLWHYSRHPNYFGELLMWWAVYLFTLSIPDGYLTIIAPLAITVSLLFVTGIPWLEQAMANNPAYQEYKRKTSILIPWFSKK